MKYYKFVNKYRIENYTKKYIIVDGKQISYPSPDTLLKAGIKPLVVEEMPELTEMQYAELYYVDGNTEIIQKWIVHDVSEEVINDEPTDD